MTTLNILSGGAAQGLVRGLAEAFKAQTGFGIDGEFGAVGIMADKLRAGTAADLVILTQALLAKLAEEKLVVPSSITDVGRVETALAVRSRDPKVTVRTEADLRDVLRSADAIYVPDTKASTAGQHVAKVLGRLGIAYEVASRLKIFPNGATAMRELANSTASRPIGCTQATEIIATDGLALSGSLPPGSELVTMYTAGVATRAAHPTEAAALIALLTGADHRELRQSAGFAG
ncbi:molybdate ABC transporter substrate-binding protein [Bradyrhizobium centrosematis]|uniref:molybdate ABC transporter substrate-binding protein n=1 Tax=Bradyrhizobium centrosematis TaxID=1300039 RepID=UPI002169C4E3|nr:substrate-binding domain-containing protein [Bradyrhizobium centrosematis]MCS3765260.1 molybdate transport system substrate-binding protein [Bradyrhizobium centrosematis]MCS3774041.1 molybdate transport system substrate-binding protein [Bradyrhizobium centrosematis]